MAKKSIIAREHKREKLVVKFKSKRDALKAIMQDPNKDQQEKWFASIELQKLPRDSSPSRHRNRCRLTGRPRGVYKKFGLARNKLREIAMTGHIPGLVKSSW